MPHSIFKSFCISTASMIIQSYMGYKCINDGDIMVIPDDPLIHCVQSMMIWGLYGHARINPHQLGLTSARLLQCLLVAELLSNSTGESSRRLGLHGTHHLDEPSLFGVLPSASLVSTLPFSKISHHYCHYTHTHSLSLFLSLSLSLYIIYIYIHIDLIHVIYVI